MKTIEFLLKPRNLILLGAGALALLSAEKGFSKENIEAKLTQTPEYSHAKDFFEWKKKQINPENPDIDHTQKGYRLLEKSEKCMDSKKFFKVLKQARISFENALSLNPNDCEAREGLGKYWHKSGFFKNAIDNLTTLDCNKDLDTLLLIADSYRMLAINEKDQTKAKFKLKKAREYITRAQEVSPESYKVTHLLGLTYANQGKWKMAEDNYFKTLDILKSMPVEEVNIRDFSNLMVDLSYMYIEFKEYEASITLLNIGMGKDPDNALLYRTMFTVYKNQGKIKTAEDWLIKAIKKAPYAENWVNDLKNLLLGASSIELGKPFDNKFITEAGMAAYFNMSSKDIKLISTTEEWNNPNENVKDVRFSCAAELFARLKYLKLRAGFEKEQHKSTGTLKIDKDNPTRIYAGSELNLEF